MVTKERKVLGSLKHHDMYLLYVPLSTEIPHSTSWCVVITEEGGGPCQMGLCVIIHVMSFQNELMCRFSWEILTQWVDVSLFSVWGQREREKQTKVTLAVSSDICNKSDTPFSFFVFSPLREEFSSLLCFMKKSSFLNVIHKFWMNLILIFNYISCPCLSDILFY